MSEVKFVVFRLAGEQYGLPIESVERILPAPEITPIPCAPPVLKGIFDLRGETVAVIDARLRFEMPPHKASNTIVVSTPDGRCAMNVDGVVGIFTFDDSQIEPVDRLKDNNDAFLRGVGKIGDRLTVLLDPDHVVPTELRRHLKQDRSATAVAA